MKNLFLLATWLLFLPAVVHAQLQKNNILLEGSFAYSRSTPKYSPTNYGQIPMDVVSQKILLSPMAGLFLTDRLLLSGGLILNRSSHKEESVFSPHPSPGFEGMEMRSSSLLISNDIAPVISLRYFYPLADKFYFSPRLGAAYHFTRHKLESSYQQGNISGSFNNLYSGNHLALSLSPQLVYFVNSWLGLEAQMGGLSLLTARRDDRYPMERQTGSSLDITLAPSAWNFGVLVKLNGFKN